MNNKAPMLTHRISRNLDWLDWQEEDSDFLLGISPNEFPDVWEDEE